VTTARKEFWVEGQAEPVSHYAHAVSAGGFLHISGCVASDASGALVGGDDPVAQTRQVLLNIASVLEAAGVGMGDVVKVTVYLTHVEDRAAMNAVRQEFFGEARPASTLVEISALAAPGARVEIDAVAYLGGPSDG
jgi:2-iminobutanoate/2-iminopropanoate deaminase